MAVKGNATKYVKLNVGGALFNTTLSTLTKNDNMLRTMFSGRMEVLTDPDGAFHVPIILFKIGYRTLIDMVLYKVRVDNCDVNFSSLLSPTFYSQHSESYF